MEQYRHHHHLVHKVSRFFPSSLASCKLRSTVQDVVESFIPITKTKTKTFPRTVQPQKSFSNAYATHKKPSTLIKPGSGCDPKTLFKNINDVKVSTRLSYPVGGSGAEGRKCPLATPLSSANIALQKKEKVLMSKHIKSTSSNSGRWFSSTDDEEEAGFNVNDGKSDIAFFSLSSSCSSESFRQKRAPSTSTSWRRCDNRIFNDLGRCSSALSAYSLSSITTAVLGNNKSKTGEEMMTWHTKEELKSRPEKLIVKEEDENFKGCLHEAADRDLTQLYYGGGSGKRYRRRLRKAGESRRKKTKKEEKERKGELITAADDDDDEEDGRLMEDSYAVEKSSSDPYGDFRTSMVEMIIEKQIFGAKDLEKLLDRFLSLNSSYYHRVIVEVFIEICDTLFAI